MLKGAKRPSLLNSGNLTPINSTTYYEDHKLGSNWLHSKDVQMANISELIRIIRHIHRTKPLHYNIVPTDAEKKKKKAFDQIQHAFNIKALNSLEIRGFPNIIRAIYDRPTVSTVLNTRKMGSYLYFFRKFSLCYFPCFSFRFYSFLGSFRIYWGNTRRR